MGVESIIKSINPFEWVKYFNEIYRVRQIEKRGRLKEITDKYYDGIMKTNSFAPKSIWKENQSIINKIQKEKNINNKKGLYSKVIYKEKENGINYGEFQMKLVKIINIVNRLPDHEIRRVAVELYDVIGDRVKNSNKYVEKMSQFKDRDDPDEAIQEFIDYHKNDLLKEKEFDGNQERLFKELIHHLGKHVDNSY